MGRKQLLTLSLGVAAGVTGALILDRRTRPNRRALIRDKLRRYVRALVRPPSRTVGIIRGPARGLLHSLAQRGPWRAPRSVPDGDAYLAQRVRTALGRERRSPHGALNIDAVDGVVRVRGTIPDAESARRVVEKAAVVSGTRAVMSLMRTPDGTPVGGRAGDARVLESEPRAAIHGRELRQVLMERWPSLTDIDIVASEGHIGHLALLIWARSGEPEEVVKAALDAIVRNSV